MKKLETERLEIRNYKSQEREHFIALVMDENVMKYVDRGVMTREASESLCRKLFEDFYPHGKDTIFGVFAKSDERYIGHAAIRPRPAKPEDWEISYMLKTGEWGSGFATEIARCLIQFGLKELDLPEVFATIDEENVNSIKVVEKAGMSFLRHEYDEDGRFSVYSIKKLSYQS